MSETPRFLMIPDRRKGDVDTLLSLTTDQLRRAGAFLRTPSQDAETRPLYVGLARDAGLPNDHAAALIRAVSNVQRQRTRYGMNDDDLVEDLRRGWPDAMSAVVGDQARLDSLKDILRDTDEGFLAEKVERLRHGLIPHYVGAQTQCDLRPAFDREKREIRGAVLVATLGIFLHDSDHHDRTVSLQMTRSDIKELREMLEEAERKFVAMETLYGPLSRVL